MDLSSSVAIKLEHAAASQDPLPVVDESVVAPSSNATIKSSTNEDVFV